jgi:hypothetical protein
MVSKVEPSVQDVATQSQSQIKTSNSRSLSASSRFAIAVFYKVFKALTGSLQIFDDLNGLNILNNLNLRKEFKICQTYPALTA